MSVTGSACSPIYQAASRARPQGAEGLGGAIHTPERIPVTVYDQPSEASRAVAREIAELVRIRSSAGQRTVLGLATGSTPVGVYDELVRLHREEGISFRSVVTFNLDEYWPIQPDALQSYHRFMREHLFDHLDIPKEQIHIPDGTVARGRVGETCAAYEESILWTLVFARALAFPAFLAVVLARRLPMAPPRDAGLAALAGSFDLVATVLVGLALDTGALSLVAVLTALYPVVAGLLAFALLKERLRPVQFAGATLALGGVLLIVAG